ncbi:MAG TPA: sugar ABC transporter permease [Acidimicrobiales bacterium]|nr:sugar ABC transporter permease [Acidimicrobiales bacterium]
MAARAPAVPTGLFRASRVARRGGQSGRPVGARSYRSADFVALAPTLVLYGGLVLVPIGVAVALSFFDWNGVGGLSWASWSNWTTFFHDPVAHHSLEVTGVLTVTSWAVQTPLAMALGLFVAGRQRYRAVYAAIYLLPLLLSTAGIALVWQALLDPTFGGLAWLSRHFTSLHFLEQNWLGGPHTALWTIVALIAWQFVPFHTLLYQMGRRQIPEVLYEAAALDGVNPLQRFWNVTLPQLRYTIVVSSTLIIVGSLTYFDMIFILTNGGPGDTTRVLSIDMYQAAFQETTFGYASVLAVVLGVIGVTVALVLFRLTGFSSMSSQREGMA